MTERRGAWRVGRQVLETVGETLHRCVLHSADTQSAALAFYTLFALAPAVVVVVSIAKSFLGEGLVRGEIVRQFQGVMGPEAGLTVAAFLEKSGGPGLGASPGGIAGIVAFALGATAVFIQLQEALNRVWEVTPRPGPMYRSLLRKRLVSFGLVLAVGLVLLVSLTLSAGLAVLAEYLAIRIPVPVAVVTAGNEVLAFLALSVLIALVYRILPDANLEWRDVRLGAVVTSLLFSAGKWLIGSFLGQTTVASRFGVAGSLVVILLWVYSVSFIVLFGAELTAVVASKDRLRPVIPESGARRVGAGAGREAA